MRFDKLSSQYLGSVGSEYEANRRDGKWDAEQQAAQELIARMPRGAKVLDAPVGIGRLIPILAAQRLKIQGLDVSPDMLAEATAHFSRSARAHRLALLGRRVVTAAVIRVGLFVARQDYPQWYSVRPMYVPAPSAWPAKGGRPSWPANATRKRP